MFLHDDEGPIYWGFYSEFEAAKKAAREAADKEGSEFFVFSFSHFIEAARFKPAAKVAHSKA